MRLKFSIFQILWLAALVLITRPVAAQDSNFHIYLAFGQSNMVGATAITEPHAELDPRVQMLQSITCETLGRSYGEWYPAIPPLFGCNGGTGLADTFLKAMAAAAPTGVKIGIVPTAIAGSDIALFEKSAPIGRGREQETRIPPQFDGGYAWLLDLARHAQRVGVIKGIIFHQGETNAGDPRWKHQVQQLVADLRSDLNLEGVPFVAGELMPIEAGSCCGFHNYQVWELPQLVPRSYVVSAAGLTGFDNAHFTAESYRELGRRYASVMLAATGSATASAPNLGCGTTGSHANCCAGQDAEIDVGSWGYQVGQSCVFAESRPWPESGVRAECGMIRGRPICCDGSKSDSDGDGWGWENQQSCIVVESAPPVEPLGGASCGSRHGHPVCCEGSGSDSDGDGWGWENSRSCVVLSQ